MVGCKGIREGKEGKVPRALNHLLVETFYLLLLSSVLNVDIRNCWGRVVLSRVKQLGRRDIVLMPEDYPLAPEVWREIFGPLI